MKKILSTLLCVFILLGILCPCASAFTLHANQNFDVEAESVVLYNFNTDTIVFEKNPDEQREPASLTKLLTALIVAELEPNLKTTMLTVDKESVDDVLGEDASTAMLQEGEVISCYDLLATLLIESACDSANVLATYYAGSIKAFVVMMNQRAKELGMIDSAFVNAHGLTPKTGRQYTTANDLVLLVNEFSKHPDLVELCSMSRYDLPATNMQEERVVVTTNSLIDGSTDAFYRYADGLKTGFTDNAGRNLIATAENKDQRYMCVLLGCPVYGEDGEYVRKEFDLATNFFEWAFNNLVATELCNSEIPLAELPVRFSPDADRVFIVPENTVSAVIPKESVESTIVEQHIEKKFLTAPVSAGEYVGYARILVAGEELKVVNLVAADDCSYSVISHFFGALTIIFTSTPFIIIAVLVVLFILFIIIISLVKRSKKRSKDGVYKYVGNRNAQKGKPTQKTDKTSKENQPNPKDPYDALDFLDDDFNFKQ